MIPCPSSIELDILLTAAAGMSVGSHAWGSAVLFCLLARFLLTGCDSKRGDYQLLHLLPGIRNGHDLSAIILAETLRGLDDVQGRPSRRFLGSPLLLQVPPCFWSSTVLSDFRSITRYSNFYLDRPFGFSIHRANFLFFFFRYGCRKS